VYNFLLSVSVLFYLYTIFFFPYCTGFVIHACEFSLSVPMLFYMYTIPLSVPVLFHLHITSVFFTVPILFHTCIIFFFLYRIYFTWYLRVFSFCTGVVLHEYMFLPFCTGFVLHIYEFSLSVPVLFYMNTCFTFLYRVYVTYLRVFSFCIPVFTFLY